MKVLAAKAEPSKRRKKSSKAAAAPQKSLAASVRAAAQPVIEAPADGPSGSDADDAQPAGPQSQAATLNPSKRKRSSEGKEHKGQLAALQETDPEFYRYLLDTDKDLLDFQTGESESDEEELEVSSTGLLA